MQCRRSPPALRPRAGRRRRGRAPLAAGAGLRGAGSRFAARLGQRRGRGALDRAPAHREGRQAGLPLGRRALSGLPPPARHRLERARADTCPDRRQGRLVAGECVRADGGGRARPQRAGRDHGLSRRLPRFRSPEPAVAGRATASRSRPARLPACMSAPIPLRGTTRSGAFPNGWRARLFRRVRPINSPSERSREELFGRHGDGGRSRTRRRGDRGARAARHRRAVALGIGTGDVVAIMLRNEPAFLEATLIARLAGCYSCPINFHYKADEAGYILRDCGAKALIVHADLLRQIDGGVPAGVPRHRGRAVGRDRAPPFGSRPSNARVPRGATEWEAVARARRPPMRARRGRCTARCRIRPARPASPRA